MSVGLGDSLAHEKKSRWPAFLTRDRLAMAPASFVPVTSDPRTFLQPVPAHTEVAYYPTTVELMPHALTPDASVTLADLPYTVRNNNEQHAFRAAR